MCREASIVNLIVLFCELVYFMFLDGGFGSCRASEANNNYYVCLAYAMYCMLFSIRRFWVREIKRQRDVEAYFARTFAIAYEKDPEAFFGMTRMTTDVFDILLGKVAHKLRRKSINFPSENEWCAIADAFAEKSGPSMVSMST